MALEKAGDEAGFPFDVPAIASLRRLDVDVPVTFFVGENGSGKSTLLEGLAAAARLPAVASEDLDRDPAWRRSAAAAGTGAERSGPRHGAGGKGV